MHLGFTLAAVLVLVLGFAAPVFAQEEADPKPIELQFLKDAVGVWDAEIEVWPQGPEAESITFKGTETNRAYGDHWIASDFESEFQGQTMKVHSIVGYDRDKKRMAGTVIDHGPYAARMTGDYDEEAKTVHWTTKVKDAAGNPIVQKTAITQKSPDERLLVLSVPGKEEGSFTKFMQIKFARRK